ncbi:hypothetical protein ACHAQJ_000945 [Trichoderma viride]
MALGFQSYKWDTQPINITALAGYHGFNEKTLANFVDTVVRTKAAKDLLKNSTANLSSLPDALSTLLANTRGRVSALPDESNSQILIVPVDLISMYTQKNRLKSFVDAAIKSLQRPLYLPRDAKIQKMASVWETLPGPAILWKMDGAETERLEKILNSCDTGTKKSAAKSIEGWVLGRVGHRYTIDEQPTRYDALLMAGFKTLTIRSSDKPGGQIEAVQKFSDARSEAQVFIANINIMSTGVNLHHTCSKGILATFHFNAKTIQQVHGRLNRLGQKTGVIWHNLKVKNSFYDHQERVMLTKWSRQLSVESNLPQWMSGALREIVLFELIRSYFNHPFNRYSWVVLADRDGKTIDYYSEEAVKLGYGLSMLAKLVTYGEQNEFWSDNEQWLAVAMIELVATRSLQEMEGWLRLGEGLLREALEQRIKDFISEARILGEKVKERRVCKSSEFVLEGDSDLEDLVEDEDADFAGEDGDRVEELGDDDGVQDPPQSNQGDEE